MQVSLVAVTKGVGKYENLTTEEIVSAIARHGVIKEDNGKLIKYLMDHKHVSPLDLVNFVFYVETSLSIGRQMLRHASIKPQEFSGRYDEMIGFEPIELRKEHPTNRQSSTDRIGELWVYDGNSSFSANNNEDLRFIEEGVDLLEAIKDYYKKGVEKGIAKECMRFFLPNCTTTKMHFNGTLRSWLSFLNVRCDHHAQQEVQDIAALIGEALEEEMPNVFSRIDWRKGMFL